MHDYDIEVTSETLSANAATVNAAAVNALSNNGGRKAGEPVKRHLSQSQIDKLDSIGFSWVTTSIRLTRWTKKFHLLRAYNQEFGTTCVPAKFDTLQYVNVVQLVSKDGSLVMF